MRSARPNWERDLSHAMSCLSDARRAIEQLDDATDGDIPTENKINAAAHALDGAGALLREANAAFRSANPGVGIA